MRHSYITGCLQLNEALEASRSEVTRLHAEREHYEETMKKAFMRGVCALNMEAMTMFHDGDSQGEFQLVREQKSHSALSHNCLQT